MKRQSLLLFLAMLCAANLLAQSKVAGIHFTDKIVAPSKFAIILYSDATTERDGQNSLLAAHYQNTGGGTFKWQKQITTAGYYNVAIAYATRDSGTVATFSDGKDSLSAGLVKTSGYYPADLREWATFNMERRAMPGKIYLPKGDLTLSLQLNGYKQSKTLLYSVAIIPTAMKDSVSADERMAEKSRPDMKWFTNTPYGVMFHWTSQSTPLHGSAKSYKDAVNDFNVEKFVKMVEKTGAGYVIFTTNHADPFFPAPLASWEKEYPGHTTQRDLIAEIADSLGKRHIKLILYMATHVYAKFKDVNDDEFQRLNFTFLSEIGARYKNKVAGFWFDGWYQCYEQHPNFNFEKFYKICKTGNQDRIICLNAWLYPIVSPWQDYWPGEVYQIGNPADSKILYKGPGAGLQTQSLIVMETNDWLHTTIDTPIPPPNLSAENLTNFIKKSKGKGPVTINIQIYQDGSIEDLALNVMEKLDKAIHPIKEK